MPLPTSTIDTNIIVGGTLTVQQGRVDAVVVVTNTYDVLVTDDTVVCNKTTAFTITLPVAAVGQKFTIKNIGVGVVTLEGNGSETIDGDLNQAIYQWESMQVQCYEAGKWVIL